MQNRTATRRSDSPSEVPRSLGFYFRKHIIGLVVGALAAMVGAQIGLSAGRNVDSEPAPQTVGGSERIVNRVVDGDSLVLIGGERVRLIGIDAPESFGDGTAGHCSGKRASRYLQGLLGESARVRVVTDVDKWDRYGRLLAYVYRDGDGLFINAAMVRGGFAEPLTIPPNVTHASEFTALARRASQSRRGLWPTCGNAWSN